MPPIVGGALFYFPSWLWRALGGALAVAELLAGRDKTGPQKAGAASGGAAGSGAQGGGAAAQGAYERAMFGLQYDEVGSQGGGLSGFHYGKAASEAAQVGPGSKRRLRRLAQEHADLSKALPLSPSSSVWVRALEGRMDSMQVRIKARAKAKK